MNEVNPWYALYTRSRHEKRVAESLRLRGIETYLPLVPKVRQWHDREKIVDWPMFPGYVFVRFPRSESSQVLAIPGAVRIIGVGGRPAPIPDEDIENVRLFASCLAATGSVPSSVPGVERSEPVFVRSGPFSGVRGIVLEHRGPDRVLIQVGVDVIGQAMRIELDVSCVQKSQPVPVREGD